eukprot:gi/632952145/ref/XP_007891687.1/ PREDICTED: HRAS-like suppressor 3 [Callorhinchus milii]
MGSSVSTSHGSGVSCGSGTKTGHTDLDIDYIRLKPGDLIKIFRGKFKHWAVYVGIGHVVHIMVQEHVWLAHLVACAMWAMVSRESLVQVAGGEWIISGSTTSGMG